MSWQSKGIPPQKLSPLQEIRPFFLGGGGGTLDSHEKSGLDGSTEMFVCDISSKKLGLGAKPQAKGC